MRHFYIKNTRARLFLKIRRYKHMNPKQDLNKVSVYECELLKSICCLTIMMMRIVERMLFKPQKVNNLKCIEIININKNKNEMKMEII